MGEGQPSPKPPPDCMVSSIVVHLNQLLNPVSVDSGYDHILKINGRSYRAEKAKRKKRAAKAKARPTPSPRPTSKAKKGRGRK